MKGIGPVQSRKTKKGNALLALKENRGNAGKKANSSDFTIVTLPRTMPLVERISEVSKRISELMESLETLFNYKTDALELTKYERNKRNIGIVTSLTVM